MTATDYRSPPPYIVCPPQPQLDSVHVIRCHTYTPCTLALLHIFSGDARSSWHFSIELIVGTPLLVRISIPLASVLVCMHICRNLFWEWSALGSKSRTRNIFRRICIGIKSIYRLVIHMYKVMLCLMISCISNRTGHSTSSVGTFYHTQQSNPDMNP